MDLGQIKITSRLENVKGKWKSWPDKLTFVNVINIDMKSFRMDFDSKSYMITPPFDMNICLKRINYTELLLDAWLSTGIDFENFDKADYLTVECSAFEMNFKQPVLTYFLRLMDLNINYYDRLEAGY